MVRPCFLQGGSNFFGFSGIIARSVISLCACVREICDYELMGSQQRLLTVGLGTAGIVRCVPLFGLSSEYFDPVDKITMSYRVIVEERIKHWDLCFTRRRQVLRANRKESKHRGQKLGGYSCSQRITVLQVIFGRYLIVREHTGE